MARTINSPGVQITETDLSQYQAFGGGTKIFVPGFAAQGPTDEVLQVTTISEFEQIYGQPQTAAERYFYYTTREVLNSPATVFTTRLPYGSGFGAGFADSYSALFFPVASAYENPVALSGEVTFHIGKPKFVNLSTEEYNNIIQNNFTWSSLSSATYADSVALSGNISAGAGSWNSGTYNATAGFIICNASKTSLNEAYEGYYFSVTDNAEFAQGSNFAAVTNFYTLTGNGDPYYSVPSSRYEFALSGTRDAGAGSVSETIESTYDWTINQSIYNDTVALNLFRIRRSIYDPTVLTISRVENHLGSFNREKQQLAPIGGIPKSSFLETIVNNSSPNLKMLVHPKLASNSLWSSNTPPKVRALQETKALYPNSVWLPSYNVPTNKVVGNVYDKTQRALTLIETPETISIDVVCDAGLSTIHTTASAGVYDDTRYFSASEFSVTDSDTVLRYRSFVNLFGNFVANTRRDCMFIADAPRQVFVTGENTKVLSVRTNTFTQNIFNPLKTLFDTVNNNYVATYGNWVKMYDPFTDKNVWMPFSGCAAAVYARTDANTQPWFAPAGLNRGTVPNIMDIAFNPNQKQRDSLYTIAVNPVAFFSGDGFTIFGQKTLQSKPSAFDRINVRRLFLTLERATQQALRFFVFEPNTEFTRTRLKNTIGPIFELARNTQGLYDYLIVCDERNNTPDAIDRNELAVDIYLKPVKAAEFILVNFIATRTGQNFQELI